MGPLKQNNVIIQQDIAGVLTPILVNKLNGKPTTQLHLTVVRSLYVFGVNVLVVYHESYILIGGATSGLFVIAHK